MLAALESATRHSAFGLALCSHHWHSTMKSASCWSLQQPCLVPIARRMAPRSVGSASPTRTWSVEAASTGLHAINESRAVSSCVRACSEWVRRMFDGQVLLI